MSTDNPQTPNEVDELRQQLAAIEHQRWADWQEYMFNLCQPDLDEMDEPTGGLVIPTELVDRWNRQIITAYAGLSEKEQASDMEQVDRYWPIVEAWHHRESAKEREAGFTTYTGEKISLCDNCSQIRFSRGWQITQCNSCQDKRVAAIKAQDPANQGDETDV